MISCDVGFRAQYGLNADGSDDELDWSGNGLANILYYAFGLGDPIEALVDATRLPQVDTSDTTISFSYLRSSSEDSGVSIYPRFSTDLETWGYVGAGAPGLYYPDSFKYQDQGDGYEQVTLEFSTTGYLELFFKVEVEVTE